MAAELDHYADALDIARLPWPKNLDAARDLERRTGAVERRPGPRRSWLDALTPWRGTAYADIVRLTPSFGEHLALARGSIAAVAIERYRRAHDGALPNALQDLVPVYLKKPPEDP